MRTLSQNLLQKQRSPFTKPYVRAEFDGIGYIIDGKVFRWIFTEPWTWLNGEAPSYNLLFTEPWSA